MSGGREKILAEICPQGDPDADPVTGFYLRPGFAPLAAEIDAAYMDETYPAPVVSSRDRVEPPDGWPGPVLTLEREASRHGWATVLAYARGYMPHATTGKPGEERDSFSVRFAHGTWQGYAIYAGKEWQSIMVTGADLPPFGKMGRTDLSTWLAKPEKLSPGWYDAIRARLVRQEANRKARDACNKGVHDQAVLLEGAAVSCQRCGNTWPVGAEPWRKPKGRGEAL